MLKIFLTSFFLFAAIWCNAQSFTYTYEDPCSGLEKSIQVPTNAITITYYGQIQTFAPADFNNGVFEEWAQNVFSSFGSNNPCATIVGVASAVNMAQNSVMNVLGILNSLDAINSISGGGMNTNGVIESSKTDAKSDKKKNKENNSQSNNSSSGVAGSSGSIISNNENQGQEHQVNSTTGSTGTTETGTTGTTETGTTETGTPVTTETGTTETGTTETGTTETGTTETGTPVTTETGTTETGTTETGTPVTTETGTTETGTTETGTPGTTENGSTGTTETGTTETGTPVTTETGTTETGTQVTTETGTTETGSGNIAESNTEPEITSTEEKPASNILGGSIGSIQNSSGSKGANSTKGNAPSIVLSSDFAGFNFKQGDVNFGGKGTAGWTSLSWDGKKSYGFMLDYTSANRGPNVTSFYASIKKNRIDLISLTGTVSFYGNRSLYGTIAIGQMWKLNKAKSLKAIYMATSSMGNVFGTKFIGTAFIAGAMYDMKIGKRTQIKFTNLFIYAPYVSYYNDLVLKSPYVIMPLVGTNIGITKKFKLNLNLGGTYAVGEDVLNFTFMMGTRFAI